MIATPFIFIGPFTFKVDISERYTAVLNYDILERDMLKKRDMHKTTVYLQVDGAVRKGDPVSRMAPSLSPNKL